MKFFSLDPHPDAINRGGESVQQLNYVKPLPYPPPASYLTRTPQSRSKKSLEARFWGQNRAAKAKNRGNFPANRLLFSQLRRSDPSSLQIFLGALLGVETDRVIVRIFPYPRLALHRGVVAFRLLHPFTSDGLHRAPCRFS